MGTLDMRGYKIVVRDSELDDSTAWATTSWAMVGQSVESMRGDDFTTSPTHIGIILGYNVYICITILGCVSKWGIHRYTFVSDIFYSQNHDKPVNLAEPHFQTNL